MTVIAGENQSVTEPARVPCMDEIPEGSRCLVVSDLHLGSRYTRRDAFIALLDRLPPVVELVMNGDIIDRIHDQLPAADRAVIERLREESRRRSIVWVYGNHDVGWAMDSPGDIRFVSDYTLPGCLYVAHGHGFDSIMPAHRWFVRLFRFMHRVRIVMGAEAVHVAAYAKRWDRLYSVLRRHVMRNAARHARQRGCPAVACGHTHFVEAEIFEGIRYFNTGSWTEIPVCGLLVGVGRDDLRLVRLA